MAKPGIAKELEETLTIVEGIYDAALAPSGWDAVLESLRRRFRSPVAGIFTQDAITSAITVDLLPGMSDKYLRLYREHIASVNPWIRVPGLMRPGRVLTDTSLEVLQQDRKAYFETEFHQDFARPQGFRHTMGGTLLAHGNKLVNFTYLRCAEEGPYDGAEVRLHMLLARHIAKAVGISQQLDALKREVSASAHLIDRLPFGVIFLDSRGRVRSADREADRLLADGDGLGTRDGVLWARRPAEARRLEIMVRGVTSRKALACEGPIERMLVSRPSGKMALSVIALPLPHGAPIFGAEGSVALLLVSDPERRPVLEMGSLAERFGFGRSEARLAVALTQGYDLRQAASMAGLTYETARSYLKRMFEKTGTHRQPDLIRLLLADLADTVVAEVG